MTDEQFHASIVRLHNKIDVLTSSVNEIKLEFAPFPFRVKILEKIVYCGTALILIAFATSLISSVINPKPKVILKDRLAVVETIK